MDKYKELKDDRNLYIILKNILRRKMDKNHLFTVNQMSYQFCKNLHFEVPTSQISF